MIKKFVFIIAAAFVVASTSAEAVDNFQIRIGIADGVASGKIYGSGIELKTAKGNTLTAANGAALSMAKGNLVVGGKQLSLPVTITAKSGLGWNGVRYRGVLRIIKAGGGFTVINVLNVEDYLRGVVPKEVSPSWNAEALKAQAVLARTYAAANMGSYSSSGYDLTNTTSSQVYGGASAESAATDKAVAETRGEILTYGGRPASIYYHADSGGATADIADVWGGDQPYLKPVAEIGKSESRYASWQMSVTPQQIAAVLKKMGHSVGTVSSMTVVKRDAAGRTVTLRFKGSRGSVDVRSSAFRTAFGPDKLRSTNFVLSEKGERPPAFAELVTDSVAAPAAQAAPAAPKTVSAQSLAARVDPLIEMTKQDVFSKDEIYDMLFHPEKREHYLGIGYDRLRMNGGSIAVPEAPKPATPPPAPAQKSSFASGAVRAVSMPQDKEVRGTIVITGKGWGHGVGLSQWGAKLLADRGAKYTEILMRYFSGTTISK